MSLYIVGVGGTTRPGSSTEKAIAVALKAAAAEGAETLLLGGSDLDLPLYAPERPDRTDRAARLVREIARADGMLVASPGYHGTVSGLVKNALDYVEDLRDDARPYLDGRAVGCIAVAYGWQAAVTTLGTLRTITHALRGWPTPLGVALNVSAPTFDADGAPLDERTRAQVRQAIDDGLVRLGVEPSERQLLEFLAQRLHAHATGQRRIDVERLLRHSLLLFGRARCQGAHVVQTI